jgi:RNA polymerase sigma-70 factor (ECF subfamily)
LKSDVVLTMPPLPLRYTGREAVVEFYARVPFATGVPLRFNPTRANRQPAVAVYQLDRDSQRYRGVGIWVLGADGAAIAEITAFVDPNLMPVFGLPAELNLSEKIVGCGPINSGPFLES